MKSATTAAIDRVRVGNYFAGERRRRCKRQGKHDLS